MAYDGTSKKLVLFGGYQCETPPCLLGDTWLWDGSNWTQAHPPTSPRAGLAYAAYDEGANKLWLLTFDGTMWSWSGSDWTRQGQYPAVAYRYPSAFIFDGSIGKIVLLGGKSVHPGPTQASVEQVDNDMWAWDGRDWRQIG
jgi:hypothetical protein